LGGLSPQWFAAAFLFALMGLFIRWYIRALSGVKNNPNSPAKFSFAYWWANNGKMKIASIFATTVIVFLCLRFSYEWFTLAPSMVLAVGIGIGFDWFFAFMVKLVNKKPAGIPDKPAENG